MTAARGQARLGVVRSAARAIGMLAGVVESCVVAWLLAAHALAGDGARG